MSSSLLLKIIPASLIVFIVSLFAALAIGAPLVHAADAKDNLCSGANLSLSGSTDCDEEEAGQSIDNTIALIVNIFSTIVGVVAVIFIIIGGFKYITSGGDSGKVGSAKTTIIYAVVGLVVVALAQVIVKFVIAKST